MWAAVVVASGPVAPVERQAWISGEYRCCDSTSVAHRPQGVPWTVGSISFANAGNPPNWDTRSNSGASTPTRRTDRADGVLAGNSGPMSPDTPGNKGPMSLDTPGNKGPMNPDTPGNKGPMNLDTPGNKGPMNPDTPGYKGPMNDG
jgi:hypothetical protein